MSDCLHVSGPFLHTTGCCAGEKVVFCVMYCTTQSSYCTGGHIERILRTIQTEVIQRQIITTCALTACFKFCAWHVLHLAPAHVSSVIKNGMLVNRSGDGLDADLFSTVDSTHRGSPVAVSPVRERVKSNSVII